MGQVVLVQEEPRTASILIEVNVPTSGQQRVSFPDISQLRSTVDQTIIIKGLRLVPAEVLVGGIISANTNAPTSELQKMALTIYSEGWEKGQTIPVITFNDYVFATGNTPYRNHATNFDNWRNVDWPKSYIQYANGTLSVGAPYVVMFDCEYIRLDSQNRQVQGPSK